MSLLSVRGLEVKFFTRRATIHAVNGISFDLERGETLGIVGESGCGKSVSALATLGILPRPTGKITRGEVLFEGVDLVKLPDSKKRRVRGKDIAMIFQDPMTSLNPVLTVGGQITESLTKHLGMDKASAKRTAIELLDRVGIPSAVRRVDDYPHQFSGGMRQRAMIAMAIACGPQLLIADEPTTALDVTIQAQILDLLKGLVSEKGMALILITHDLGVVAGMCERTNVMYAGRFVETAATAELFERPRHPYTLGLLKSIPRLDALRSERLEPIGGAPPEMSRMAHGCPFAPRCDYATDRSRETIPELRPIDGPDHEVACWNPVPDADLPRFEVLGNKGGDTA